MCVCRVPRDCRGGDGRDVPPGGCVRDGGSWLLLFCSFACSLYQVPGIYFCAVACLFALPGIFFCLFVSLCVSVFACILFSLVSLLVCLLACLPPPFVFLKRR